MNKVDAYRQMADQATASLTAQVKDWCRFLVMAGQFYKYNFLDQVMICTQRPDATACAGFDLWTRRMKRGIRRGSKGIALLRYRDGRLFLWYVFDVSDTVRRENARDPRPWTYRDEYEAAVTARLEECFGMPADNKGLANQLIALSIQFAEQHWNDFKYEIMHSLCGSRLEGLDEDNVSVRFQSAALVSLAFLLLARCGFDLDKAFAPNDLDCVAEFDTKDTILALGNAVSESANVLLRQVEYAIRKYERDKAAGNLPPAPPPVDAPAPSVDETAAEDPAPAQPSTEAPAADDPTPADPPADDTAAGEQPAAASVLRPDTAAPAVPEESGQICLLPPEQPSASAHPSENHAATAANFRITDDDLGVGGPK